MANMNDPGTWRDPDALIEHLAGELVKGRLALILGAGVSTFYGLPNWTALVNRIADRCGESPLKAGDDPVIKIGAIRTKLFRDKKDDFLKLVGASLYDGITLNFDAIRKNDTLSAIGSLVMASKRGSASTVINFNFDDLLEIYLEYHGFATSSIFKERFWTPNQDVTIYHPHGLLPLSREHARSEDIVLGVDDYLKIMRGGDANLWRSTLQTLLRTRTYIYIGLSGRDNHLQSLLSTLRDEHAIHDERLAYLGVRFAPGAASGDDIATLMEGWGVFTHPIADYTDIPPFLFKVCQMARRIRLAA